MVSFIQGLRSREIGRNPKDVKGHYGCVNAVEFSNSEELCASGGDDCGVLLWRVSDLQTVEAPKPVATMSEFHTSNIFALIATDICYLFREFLRLLPPSDLLQRDSAMYARWNDAGNGIFATRSHFSPVYYDLQLENGNYVNFDDPGYKNVCTVKSCSFITQDLVMTGSDDWNIYIWKIPAERENSAYKILKGHRSIVNHCRYSSINKLIISSGVEKIIKVSPIFY
ncbi:unnamed protein product [Dracunculus medinensis]|uniref:WD_REPEATS_REGION domain-containing protein n=1 Tax=Dracunculus medinensis TaxID=318479 RepID=A0A0N4U4Q9_DRAME|nr:unnamed protein product [Dracunculus medinensis]